VRFIKAVHVPALMAILNVIAVRFIKAVKRRHIIAFGASQRQGMEQFLSCSAAA